MTTAKKIIAIVVIILALCIVAGAGLYYFYFTGFSKEAKYKSCIEECEDLMILESSKQYCKPRCSEITGYDPSSSKTRDLEKETKTQTQQAVSESEESEITEYYCEWSWPQKIINRKTKKVVKPCSHAQPWCNHADFSYEKVGCCKDREHENCITLPNL